MRSLRSLQPIQNTPSSNGCILSRGSPPCLLPRRKQIVDLLQSQSRRFGDKQESQYEDAHRHSKVEIPNIRLHIPVLRIEHIGSPEIRPEREDIVEERRIRLSIRPQPHTVHLRRSKPGTRPNEPAKDKRPQTDERHHDVLGREALVPERRAHR